MQGPGTNGTGGGRGRTLHTHSVPVHLCLRLQRGLAARRSDGRRMRGARSLYCVPPDADVLPSSLEDKHTSVTVNTLKMHDIRLSINLKLLAALN